jgi:hypothetical protein
MSLTGGCQCGAVRYRIEGEVSHSHFCHCRMCQRATGGVFAALAGVAKDHLTWTGGAPAVFASSSVAERAFCDRCGTPLTFAYVDSAWMNVTIGSLDDPEAAPIVQHWGVESKVPWLKLCEGLPEHRTGEGLSPAQIARQQGMTSHQGEAK